jgi:hypothetical protein
MTGISTAQVSGRITSARPTMRMLTENEIREVYRRGREAGWREGYEAGWVANDRARQFQQVRRPSVISRPSVVSQRVTASASASPFGGVRPAIWRQESQMGRAASSRGRPSAQNMPREQEWTRGYAQYPPWPGRQSNTLRRGGSRASEASGIRRDAAGGLYRVV